MVVWRSWSFIGKGRQLSNIAAKSMDELWLSSSAFRDAGIGRTCRAWGDLPAGLSAPLRHHDIATASVKLRV